MIMIHGHLSKDKNEPRSNEERSLEGRPGPRTIPNFKDLDLAKEPLHGPDYAYSILLLNLTCIM